MTAPGATDSTDTTAPLFVLLTVVGLFVWLMAFLVVTPLPIFLVMFVAGWYSFVAGVVWLFAHLSPSQSAILAYLTGGKPGDIPRWVYAGLVAGMLAEAGQLVLFYYVGLAPNRGSTVLEVGVWAILFTTGIEMLRYPVAFLRGYWSES